MTSEDYQNGRTNPPGNEDSSGEDEVVFYQSAPGNFRGKVTDYTGTSQYPTVPAYNIGVEVYLVIPSQTQPAGPYEVTQTLEGKMYRIKNKSNGQQYSSMVRESDLVYKVT
ncbi:hypothetical protein BDV96DRAFT_580473 [Lophiotrema nucula]|uniref:Uncharacterized protein n=1 Tax=Lophiotrema nucula TaxID=690887 RepID=A0A6A5YYR1_9PLEO|nr:hypothetical protein BDV96DRAFT_580473 [Lophiotrema nucula]